MDDGQVLSEQELVIHLFAPETGPHAELAYQQLGMLWQRCRDRLGMSQPVAALGLPGDPPAELAGLPKATPDRNVAALESGDRNTQVILRRSHDVLVLSVALAHPKDGRPGRSWPEYERQWAGAVDGIDLSVLLGWVILYLAKAPAAGWVAATTEMAQLVARSLPGDGDMFAAAEQWSQRGLPTATGLAAWEVSPRGADERSLRRIVVLAPPERDEQLGVCVWDAGQASMPYLARYLMHAAKLRYQLRVLRSVDVVGDLCERVDQAARDATPALQAARLGTSLAGERVERTRDLLTRLWVDRHELIWLNRQLTGMARSVEIARGNMIDAVRPHTLVEASAANLVSDDLSLADYLTRQLGADTGYLTDAATQAEHTLSMAHGVDRYAQALAAAQPSVGIITALPEEYRAVQAMLDDVRPCPRLGDPATYDLATLSSALAGRPHHLVLTLLTQTGNVAAAQACDALIRSFPTVDLLIMVGIACGVPRPDEPARHVRLGDIVIATEVVEFDHVRDTVHGVALRRRHAPPAAHLAAPDRRLAAMAQADQRPWESYLDTIAAMLAGYQRPDPDTDRLYANDFSQQPVEHPNPAASGHRPGRPKVHHGALGSSNTSFRNAAHRDQAAAAYGLIAIEMEAAGVVAAAWATGRHCFAIRGISDYGDHHTLPGWRNYAALTAAAYTKALLTHCAPPLPRPGPDNTAPGGSGLWEPS
jgi:nucleoside phosphorylase